MTDEPIQSIRALRLGDEAPAFRARSTQGPVALDDFRGHWLLLFSHPADFTPVCTSEFIAMARAADAFARLDCRLLALSIDSLYAHLAWAKAIESEFKVKIPFPIVEDPSMAVAKAYGMLDEGAADTATVRASFFIDPTGIIRAMTWYPMNVGRSVDESAPAPGGTPARRSGRRFIAGRMAAGRRCAAAAGPEPGRGDRPLLVLSQQKRQ